MVDEEQGALNTARHNCTGKFIGRQAKRYDGGNVYPVQSHS